MTNHTDHTDHTDFNTSLETEIFAFRVKAGNRTERRFDLLSASGALVADRLTITQAVAALVRRGFSENGARLALASALTACRT